jgi:carboxypeptidase Taq
VPPIIAPSDDWLVSVNRAESAYEELLRRSRQETLLASCSELLGWDEETYMPPGGVCHRAEQQTLLAGILHERGTDPRVGELLAAVEASPLMAGPDVGVNVREWRRVYDRAVRLPRTLVEESARVASLAQVEWVAARREANFNHFLPWLERIVALKRQEADCLGYADHPYDAVLEEYEPGTRTAALGELFGALLPELVALANRLLGAARPAGPGLRGEFPIDGQRVLAERVAAAIGFNFQAGRLDTATHPFSSPIGPGDCRLATRFHPETLEDGLFATLHEAGHGLYEQGLDPTHYATPLGQASSLAIHESQARLWENAVGRSRPFWEFLTPIARKLFPTALRGLKLEDCHAAVNRVAATPIRVTADEVTYNLHILIRFDLERALLAGDLAARELPGAWNEAYRHHLGITPANDAEGCLQDGHWATGLIGYFPTYTLGNLYAAQLFDRASSELPGLETAFKQGDFRDLLGWLRTRIHREGGRYTAAELMEQATGALPDHRAFVRGLQRKYTELYRL